MDTKIGVTLGCIVALVSLVVATVSKFDAMTTRLDNIEVAAKARPDQPAKADPVEVPTKGGDKVTVQPVAVNVSAKELACLKLADGLTKASNSDQYEISNKMEDLKCFK